MPSWFEATLRFAPHHEGYWWSGKLDGGFSP